MIIYSIKLTDGNTRWMCKVCWKLTTKTPEQSQLCSSVFSVSIVDFELVKSRLGIKSHHSKKPWYSSFVVRKKHLFMVVRGKLRTCDTSKMVLFCENSLPFKVVNNFEKKLHFKIYYGVLNPLGYFFRFTFIIDLFCSPNVFKY